MVRWAAPASRRLVAALALAFLTASAAFAGDVSFAVKGWNKRIVESGTTFFECAHSRCADRATVSLRPQPAFRGVTAASLKRMTIEKAGQAKTALPSLASVSVGEPTSSAAGGVKVLRIATAYRYRNGDTDHFIQGIIQGPGETYSLASSSAKERPTAANFESFLPAVIGLAKAGPGQ